MSVVKRRKYYNVPMQNEAADRQEALRSVKLEAEQLRDKLQKSIIDNPQAAKKAALLISLWIAGKESPRKKKNP